MTQLTEPIPPSTALRVDRRYCKTCDYDLSATAQGQCPECGRAFLLGDRRTFRAFPRRSWRARLRRWGWLAAIALLVGGLWPAEWVVTKMTWVDPVNGTSVESTALVVAYPWWLKGWFRPFTWSTATGASHSTPREDTGVQMVDSLWRSNGARLWSRAFAGQGRLTVVGVPAGKKITPGQWEADLRAYVRECAAQSCSATARDGNMSIAAPAPPWMDRLGTKPQGPLSGDAR